VFEGMGLVPLLEPDLAHHFFSYLSFGIHPTALRSVRFCQPVMLRQAAEGCRRTLILSGDDVVLRLSSRSRYDSSFWILF
jgi:hypothetical protein